MLPSNTWNTNIYNKMLGFIIKKLHKDNNMGGLKIILCSFLITIICLLPYTGNNTSTDRFYKQLRIFLPVIAYSSNIALFIQFRCFSFSTVILNDYGWHKESVLRTNPANPLQNHIFAGPYFIKKFTKQHLRNCTGLLIDVLLSSRMLNSYAISFMMSASQLEFS